MTDIEPRSEIIGSAEGEPARFSLAAIAARRDVACDEKRRAASLCFDVTVDAWRSDPLGALRAAEAAHNG
jgi:hypothetical protein